MEFVFYTVPGAIITIVITLVVSWAVTRSQNKRRQARRWNNGRCPETNKNWRYSHRSGDGYLFTSGDWFLWIYFLDIIGFDPEARLPPEHNHAYAEPQASINGLRSAGDNPPEVEEAENAPGPMLEQNVPADMEGEPSVPDAPEREHVPAASPFELVSAPKSSAHSFTEGHDYDSENHGGLDR